MPVISITSNALQVYRQMEELSGAMRKGIPAEALAIANVIRAVAIRSLSENGKTGNVYEIRRSLISGLRYLAPVKGSRMFQGESRYIGRGNKIIRRGKTHIASAPGQAPSTDTGLMRSRVIVKSRISGTVGQAEVGSWNLDYPRILEEQMNRPWLMPAVAVTQARWVSSIDSLVESMIARVSGRH